MSDIMLHGISETMLRELQHRAQQNGHSVADEARAIVEDVLLRSRYGRLAKEEGIASALQALGREFDITDEFDNLRQRMQETPPRP